MTRPPHRPFLCLGTVQTGMAYGLAGAGLPDEAAAAALFDAAAGVGIRSFDTARAYGLAEARLGAWLHNRRAAEYEVISKFPKLADLDDSAAISAIRLSCAESRHLLGKPSVDGLLAHSGRDILRPAIAEALRGLVREGWILAFGGSVYDPSDADALLTIDGLGLLQVPFGLLDPRFPESGVLRRARRKGVRVYARSLYTQGLLFLDPDALPPHLATAAPVLRDLRQISAESGYSLAALALGAAASIPELDGLVIGCDTPAQVTEAMQIFQTGLPPEAIIAQAVQTARQLPAGIADPRLWKKQ